MAAAFLVAAVCVVFVREPPRSGAVLPPEA
jgi:hypothetical protein